MYDYNFELANQGVTGERQKSNLHTIITLSHIWWSVRGKRLTNSDNQATYVQYNTFQLSVYFTAITILVEVPTYRLHIDLLAQM